MFLISKYGKPVLQNDWNQYLSLVHFQLQKKYVSEFTRFSVIITKDPHQTLIELDESCIRALYRLYSICRLWHSPTERCNCPANYRCCCGWIGTVRFVTKSCAMWKNLGQEGNYHLQYVPWSKALKGKIHLQMYSVLLTLRRASLSLPQSLSKSINTYSELFNGICSVIHLSAISIIDLLYFPECLSAAPREHIWTCHVM